MDGRGDPTGFEMDSVEALTAAGFEGFVSVTDLLSQKCAQVPAAPGVYLVLRPDATPPRWLDRSTGYHFKRRNPGMSPGRLLETWLPAAILLYIGKAGTASGKASLRSRLLSYVRFGAGEPAAHWGGRYIWQLGNSCDLLVAWKTTVVGRDPRVEERALIEDFKVRYGGRRPFANLRE